jgi:regulator of replication initiation timing
MIQLLIFSLISFVGALYYQHKNIEQHKTIHTMESMILTYLKNIVRLDEENKTLKLMNDNLKLENSELRSGIYTGYTSPTVMSATVNSNGHLE